MRQPISKAVTLLALLTVWGSARASDPTKFEVLGLRLGMTAEQVEKAVREKTTKFRKDSAPPSGQHATQAGKPPQARVRAMQFETDHEKCDALFVQMPAGSMLQQISCAFYAGNGHPTKVPSEFVQRFGEPDQREDRIWVWGDTAFLYSRKRPYLELNVNPTSAFPPKPTAAIILADPEMKRIADEAARAGSRAQK